MEYVRKPMSAEMVCKAVDSLNAEDQVVFLKNEYIDLANYQRNQEYHKNNVIRKLKIINEKQLVKMSKLENLYRTEKLSGARKLINTVSLNEERKKQIQNAKTFEDTLTTVTAFLTEANMQNALLFERNRQLTEQIETARSKHCARKDAVEKNRQNIDIDKEIRACSSRPVVDFTFDEQTLAEKPYWKEPIDEVNRIGKLMDETEFVLQKDINDNEGKAISDQIEKIQHLEKELAEWRVHYFNLLEASQATQAELTNKVRESDRADMKLEILRKLCKQFQVERESCISAMKNVDDDLQTIVTSQGGEEDDVGKWTWNNINNTPAENITIQLDQQNKQITLDEIRGHFAEVYIEVEQQIVRLMNDPNCKEIKVQLFVAMLPRMMRKLKQIQGNHKSIIVPPPKPDGTEEDEGADIGVQYYIEAIEEKMDGVEDSN